jgi:hypothetical protein
MKAPIDEILSLSTEALEQFILDYPSTDEVKMARYMILLLELKRREILEKRKPAGYED